MAARSHDHVIDHLNSNELPRRPQAFRHRTILAARRWVTAGMIVHEHHSSRGLSNRTPKHFARMDEARRQRSDGNDLAGDQSMTPVEKKDVKGLATHLHGAAHEMPLHIDGTTDSLSKREWCRTNSKSEFDRRTDRCGLGRTESGEFSEPANRSTRQPLKPADLLNQLTRENRGVAFSIPRPQDQREKLRFTQHLRAKTR